MGNPSVKETAGIDAAVADNARVMEVLDHTFFSLAHELGNPINSIKMTLEVLLSNYESYSAETRLEYLKGIHAEFHRLEELLNAIRSFNQFEHLTVQATDVFALVRNLLQLLRAEIDEKGITLAAAIPESAARVSCDPRALQQCLLNVIANALDALAGRSDPLLSIAVEPEGEVCRIRIGDNGAGVPELKREDVFLPFHSGKPHGAGLGLTMARKLLMRMNGTIALAARPPQGTEVLITLPLAPSHGE